jgi:large subunit ribosomal protein L21
MFAVIKAGGKQYRVAANDVIKVERISGEPGDIVELGQVLMLSGDKGVEIGSPLLAGVTVAAEVLRQEKGDTIIIFKKRRRHHYRRRNGHRQSLTSVKITEILTEGRKPDGRKASKPAAAPKETKAPPPEASAEIGSPAPARAKAPVRRVRADSAPKSKTTSKAKPKSK